MFETIYIEEAVDRHPRVAGIVARFPNATIIPCKRYTEIFNRKAQNFRLQKHRPALILAEKFSNFILQAPDSYGIGSENNFYFSHMLNCIYDCRYCFLQGMYRSAHYVLFVNYETFAAAITAKILELPGQECHFFSGYDCDSLALEPVTGFVENFLPIFRRHPQCRFELRTKSTQIRSLLATDPLDNVIIAYSFTPGGIAAALEHKTPNPERRLECMRRLQSHGWRLGLRFDPIIYEDTYRDQYRQLFSTLFTQLDIGRLHSVSMGSFRLPKAFFRTMTRLYPDEVLFASPLEDKAGMFSYRQPIQEQMLRFCRDEILKYVPEQLFFSCETVME
ncbi:MAG: radical SAM protein [Gammaproteobacteria bacterium]